MPNLDESTNIIFFPLEEETAEHPGPSPITPDGREDAGETNTIPETEPSLTVTQRADISAVLDEFPDVLSESPGCTSTLMHDIEICSTERVKPRLYPIPIHLKPYFEEEVDQLLQQGVIQPSTSPHRSPIVMVKKANGSYRMAIDFRALNSVTVFHAEPITTMTEDIHKFYGSKYFSELDLTKAYYQVPLTDRAKPLTAFPTHKGLMEFCRLPFGLVTACATYIRLMRIVLSGLDGVSFYFDNIFVYGTTWDEHIVALRSVFYRLREHGLTARPSKCRFGFGSIQYLGFIVDGKTLRPQHHKVAAISSVNPPSTKKLLRSFLGMISFYRNFIPQASSYTSCLSDLLKKDVPEPLVWTDQHQASFQHLKSVLQSEPILQLPDSSRPFVLRTDASNLGLGAVLLQYVGSCPHPVAYASRKLLDRERRYSTIEKECLAIGFGIGHFDYYLKGKEFILEVDHKPLVFLSQIRATNDKLLRWALKLQDYRFRIVHIPGKHNVGADFLSRC